MSFLNPLKQLSTGKAALWLRYIRDFDGILNPSQLAMLHQGTSSQSSIKGQLSIKQRIGGRQISAFLSPPDFGGKLTRMSQSARQVLGNALQSSLEQRAKESLEKMTIFTVTSHENTGLLALPFSFSKEIGNIKRCDCSLKGKNFRSFLRLLTKLMKLTEVHTSPPLILGLEKDLVRLEVKVYNLFRLLLTSSNPTLSKKNFK